MSEKRQDEAAGQVRLGWVIDAGECRISHLRFNASGTTGREDKRFSTKSAAELSTEVSPLG